MKSSIRSTAGLARLLGVSRWTVSRALNGQPGVSDATAARIKAAAQQRGFSPSFLGRGLRAGETNLVGICLPDLEEYFLTTKISFLRNALEANGLRPLFQITDGTVKNENSTLEHFAAMRCAGVIGIASRLRDRDSGLRSLADARIPVVRIDPLHRAATSAVHTDRRAAMQEVIQHLHGLGHRGVIAAGFSPSGSYGKQRIAGLRLGCRSVGWDPDRDLTLLQHPGGPEDFSAGVALGDSCFSRIRHCPAILAINDRIAVGLLRYLQGRGLTIPDDATLIGYDNSALAPFAGPGLTSTDPRVEELVTSTVKLLIRKSPSRPQTVSVLPRLVPRASSAAAPSRRAGPRPE